MTSLRVRSHDAEQMDAPDLDPAVYRAVLADLASVNRLTLAQRPTLAFLARAVRGRRAFSLLDVGFGHGDMLRRIARWARRRGIAAELVGVDLNPNSAAIARAATPEELAIDFRTGEYHRQGRFDLVISSIVTHHMAADELTEFLRFMEAEARLGWLVNDLHRHRLAYLGFSLLAAAMRWHPIVRADGMLSVARSFRPEDWRAELARAGISTRDAAIVRRFPFRLCVERLR